jgi:hypothetical protein
MECDKYTKMLQAAKIYHSVGGLQKMTLEQLENTPKEVMISLASNEIALVWDKLPNNLKHDPDIENYRFCYEHHSSSDDSNEDKDVADGPIPRKLFCCYCKISDVKIKTETNVKSMDGAKEKNSFNYLACCKQQ